MKLPLLKLSIERQRFFTTILAVCFLNFFVQNVSAQGTWTALTHIAPNPNLGGMLVLSDGTILCKTSSGTTDGIGNLYNRLTPDASGSYANGTWSSIAAMHNTRLYYSSQVLKDGRVYVAGGEYGTGGSSGETYNPLTNVWTNNAAIGSFVSDANSEILENGTILQALVTGTLRSTKLYDPVANVYSTGPTALGIHNESAWLKLPDNSILFINRGATSSERYIPALNQWIADATVPVSIYDPFGLESGGALLLPNGQGLFLGSLGHNALYTPSGSTAMGTWTAAADFPNGQGTPDAPAVMLVNGKVLCVVSAKPTSANHFPVPASYYEYDYTTNTFTRVNAPAGGLTDNISSYQANMIALPNGQVLYADQGSNQYYVYTPGGTSLTSGKPVITKIQKSGPATFMFVGHLFNGISEGSTYGDDWQLNSNYPLIRITAGTKVFYARSFNWNSTGVMRGGAADTVFVTPPTGLPKGPYSIQVVANGIASDPVVAGFNSLDTYIAADAVAGAIKLGTNQNNFSVYPNPAVNQTSLQFNMAETGSTSIRIVDMNGKNLKELFNGTMQKGYYNIQVSTADLPKGVYNIRMVTSKGTQTTKLVVQ